MIKLIASDIDGTLVLPDLTITPRVRAAIQAAQARGIIVTLATGRGAVPTDQFADSLGLTAPLVCMQGAQIFDHRKRQILHETFLPDGVKEWAIGLAAGHGWDLHFESREFVYHSNQIDSVDPVKEIYRLSNRRGVDSFMEDMPEHPHKFLIALREPAEAEGVMSTLRAAVAASGFAVEIVASSHYLIEGLARGINKAVGLEWLTRQLNIDPADVLAIGDNDNDVEMLSWAGMGVAMGNASARARAAARWIAPTLHEDGVAVAIERFALGETAP